MLVTKENFKDMIHIEDEIELPEVTYFNVQTGEHRTVEYLEVGIAKDGQEECHMLRVARREFESYLEDKTTWLIFYSLHDLYSVEHRDKLRTALKEYLRNEYFGGRLSEDLKEAEARNQYYIGEILDLRKQLYEALNPQVKTFQSKINTMHVSQFGCKVREIKKTA